MNFYQFHLHYPLPPLSLSLSLKHFLFPSNHPLTLMSFCVWTTELSKGCLHEQGLKVNYRIMDNISVAILLKNIMLPPAVVTKCQSSLKKG